MDKLAIIIVFYVIAAIIRLVSSAAKNQTPGAKPTQIRLKPEDLLRIAQQRQKKTETIRQSVPALPPLPDLPDVFFDAPPDEKALDVDEEFPKALDVSENDMTTFETSGSSTAPASLLSQHLGKQALQGIIWSEILRPPLSKRR